ncbi:MAG: hypothetical protein AABY13_01135 [Nanoarchaeota archaeon]
MTAFDEFLRSFKALDSRFFITWFIDALFYLSVAVIIALSYIFFGSVSQDLLALQDAVPSEALVPQIYAQLYSILGALLVMIVAAYVAYVIFQAALWSVVLRQRISARFMLRYALYLLVCMPIIIVAFTLVVLVFGALFTLFNRYPGAFSIGGGFVLSWLAYALLLPFSIFPTYAYFKEKSVWKGVGRMTYLLLGTVPRLWKRYALAGLVLLLVTQVYRLLSGLDASLGGFLLLILILSPVLAWFRFYMVGALETAR